VTKAQFGFCSSAVDADAMTGLHLRVLPRTTIRLHRRGAMPADRPRSNSSSTK
jgi:hypothetical protein